MNIKVTIFEDNAILRRGLSTLINCSDGFECAGAFSNCDNLETNIKLTMPDPSLQIFVLIRNLGGTIRESLSIYKAWSLFDPYLEVKRKTDGPGMEKPGERMEKLGERMEKFQENYELRMTKYKRKVGNTKLISKPSMQPFDPSGIKGLYSCLSTAPV